MFLEKIILDREKYAEKRELDCAWNVLIKKTSRDVCYQGQKIGEITAEKSPRQKRGFYYTRINLLCQKSCSVRLDELELIIDGERVIAFELVPKFRKTKRIIALSKAYK